MSTSRVHLLRSLAIGISVLMCFAPPLEAGDRGVPPKDLVPIEDILAKARQDKAGTVVEVDLDHREKGRYVYEVEIVDDAGVEWDLTYDARP